MTDISKDEQTAAASQASVSEPQVQQTADADAVSAKPTPVPKPSKIAPAKPAAPQVPTATVAAPAVAPVENPEDAAKAAAFGVVTEDGTVQVREGDEVRTVGQVPGADRDGALELYIRRFLELQAKVTLFEARLEHADLGIGEIDSTLAKLTEELQEPAAVGDLVGLRERLEALRTRAAERRSAIEAERAAAKAKAVAERTALVEDAERIIATEPAKRQWRPSGEKLRTLLDSWKEHQRTSARIDRPIEEELWKRFSQARTTFDRERRHYFAQLEQEHDEIRKVKEKLIADAESLSNSTDWNNTARAYRDLMQQWKNASRLSRKEEETLWTRFRSAQDVFFDAKKIADSELNEEFAQNLVAKQELLTQAEKLVPVKNLDQAKAALRKIQEQWEAIGKVPREDLGQIEGRLRAVERTIKTADDDAWRRSNPETQARVAGATSQLQDSIDALEKDLAAAQESKDQRKIKETEAALTARRSWLQQITKNN